MLFGSDVFEEYVGELQLAMSVEASADLHSGDQGPIVFDSEADARAYQRAEQAKVRAKLEVQQKVRQHDHLGSLFSQPALRAWTHKLQDVFEGEMLMHVDTHMGLCCNLAYTSMTFV